MTEWVSKEQISNLTFYGMIKISADLGGRACGRSFAGIVGLNPAEGIDVFDL
jgi:hypothetical protein